MKLITDLKISDRYKRELGFCIQKLDWVFYENLESGKELKLVIQLWFFNLGIGIQYRIKD